MIEGMVNAAYEAVVSLSLQGAEGQTQDIEAVVDTGYTGFLTLPPALVDELELPFAYVGRAFLANDDQVEFHVHDVTLLWDGEPRDIEADATGSTPLVGMLLLNGHDLKTQVGDGGRVMIQARE
ncbi:MAG: clan AA aspartic protease [Chloroflexota bacterium]|nr:clan AA aspartic protease [Chloroflexota bacterium]